MQKCSSTILWNALLRGKEVFNRYKLKAYVKPILSNCYKLVRDKLTNTIKNVFRTFFANTY